MTILNLAVVMWLCRMVTRACRQLLPRTSISAWILLSGRSAITAQVGVFLAHSLALDIRCQVGNYYYQETAEIFREIVIHSPLNGASLQHLSFHLSRRRNNHAKHNQGCNKHDSKFQRWCRAHYTTTWSIESYARNSSIPPTFTRVEN